MVPTEAHAESGDSAVAPLPELQLVSREQLRVSLKSQMTPATFANWLHRQQKDHGFPEPLRTGKRSCSWALLEVRRWLENRPRKGVFTGRRAVR
jgi:predicted DNA-binding transcriptional regulator AlpA